MENQFNQATKLKPDFPFVSLRKALEILDCSKFYLYKLIKNDVLHPYYLEKNKKGQPSGKPYFNTDEIAQLFFRATKNSLKDEVQ